mgnify:CR=1 FL=1
MKKFVIVLLVCIAVYMLAMKGYERFVREYNSRIVAERESIKLRVQSIRDSIPIMESRYKELERVQELSFTSPVTPEHVRGEDLRAVLEGMDDCTIWLFNRKNELEALEAYIAELDQQCHHLCR